MKLLVAFIMVAVSVTAVAAVCGPASPRDGDSNTSGIVSGDRMVVEAPIDEAEIIVRESFPPQYAVQIRSGLPSGCAEFHEAKVVSKSERTFEVKVTNTMPTDDEIACTMIYGLHDSTVELGSDLESGQEYVVQVNDTELRFTAQ